MATALMYIFLCLVWGSTWLFIRLGLADMPPFWSLALRQIVAFIFLAIVALRERSSFLVIRKRIWLVLLIGILTHPVSYSLVYWGEQYVSSGLAAVLFSGMPFFVALLSWWLLPHERVTWIAAGGLIVGFTGLVVIYWAHIELGGPLLALGMACIIGSGFIAATTTVVVKRWLADASAVGLATTTVVVGAVVMPVVATTVESAANIQWTAMAMGATLYLGIFGSGLTFILYYRLLSRLPALSMSLIAFITPLVALLLGNLFDHEVHTTRSVIGTVMVLSGVFLASFAPKRPSPAVRIQ